MKPAAGSVHRSSGASASGTPQASLVISPGPDAILPVPVQALKKPSGKTGSLRDHHIRKDVFYTIRHKDALHIVSEDYSYKSETYYTILKNELDGNAVFPASCDVLDAYVVPNCLERAKLAGIPVSEWGISQAYVPLPAIIYGLNYFSCPSEYFVVDNHEKAKDVIKHVTNNGKYPFCYQRLNEDSSIVAVTSVFGRTPGAADAVVRSAEKIYDLFAIPLSRLVFVRRGEDYTLSSIGPARYSQLHEDERHLLCAYLSNQEFL